MSPRKCILYNVVEVLIFVRTSVVTLASLRWKEIEEVRDLLAPFASTVNDLEGDSYVTLSKVLPAIIDLIESLPLYATRRSAVESTRMNLRKELERRFAFILDPSHTAFQPAHMLATFFDPEYVCGLPKAQRDACKRIAQATYLDK